MPQALGSCSRAGDWLVLLTLWLMRVLVGPLLRLQFSLQRSQLTFNRGERVWEMEDGK